MRPSIRSTLALAVTLAAVACEKRAAPPPAAVPPAAVPPIAFSKPPAGPRPPAGVPAPPDVAAAPSDAVRTKSGLASKVLRAGNGTQHPGPHDRVKIHYTGWTKDGATFDSSVTRGVPAQFLLDRVIAGWTEGLQLMVTGEKRRFWIPAALAYGHTPARRGLPAGPLTFDIELIDIWNGAAATSPVPAAR